MIKMELEIKITKGDKAVACTVRDLEEHKDLVPGLIEDLIDALDNE